MSGEADVKITELVNEHHESVYRYAYRLTGRPHEAEDLTQQVFLTAHERLDQLRQPEAARSWLFTILKRGFLKSRRRSRPVAAADFSLNLENVPAETPRGEEIDRERLQQALDALAPKHRVVLLMFYFEQASYREIAEALDVPIGTIMSRLARAKAQLRQWLFAAEGETEGLQETTRTAT
ncbi:MAG: RNA polymerase sigma factor [Sedimentisphaerales bacterium]|nr:RNA polymerase sigma factor [Sedimentisphaerales bacterium]